jgi:MtfA peptidase
VVFVGFLCVVLAAIAFLYTVVGQVAELVGMAGYFLTPLRTQDRELIAQHNTYYRSLAAGKKIQFAKRVKHFIYDKDWIGKDIAVSMEMRLRVAAVATELTMGFEPLLLLHFEKILIYPDVYVERSTGHRQIGGTMPGRRTIAISWKHFVEGEANANDARHVGLHEMAHALWLENTIPNGEDDFLDAGELRRWRVLAEDEAVRIRAGRSALFRAYAGTNQAEFFAVAVEYFFEQPVAYRKALPELYGCMARLLKQDPAEALVPTGEVLGP